MDKKSKATILDSLEKRDYTFLEVKNLIESVEIRERVVNISRRPKFLKKGDVFLFNIGKKERPCVVVSVNKEYASAIPLSTTKDFFNLCESTSRILKTGFFSNYHVNVECSFALDNFICQYDNMKGLNLAIQKLKEFNKTSF